MWFNLTITVLIISYVSNNSCLKLLVLSLCREIVWEECLDYIQCLSSVSGGFRHVPYRVRVRLARKRNEDEDSPNKLYTLVTHVPVTTFKGKPFLCIVFSTTMHLTSFADISHRNFGQFIECCS